MWSHAVVAHGELVDQERRVLNDPVEDGRVLLDLRLDSRLQPNLDCSGVRRHIPHSLFDGAVRLRIVCRGVARDRSPGPHALDLRLHGDN